MTDAFDADAAFGDDYLYFYAQVLGDARSDADTEAAVLAAGLTAGQRVLDVPCGHGRLAVRLAARGLQVTGVDRSEPFIDVARRDAAARDLAVDLRVGDMRALPTDGPFDAVLCWFTSFGYFDDASNIAVLREFHRVLVEGGTLAVETLSHDGYVRTFTEAPEAIVLDVDGDLMVDRNRFDVATGRIECHRVTVRADERRETRFFIRLPTLPEWRAWLTEAGFRSVRFTEPEGGDVDLDSWRIVVSAEA